MRPLITTRESCDRRSTSGPTGPSRHRPTRPALCDSRIPLRTRCRSWFPITTRSDKGADGINLVQASFEVIDKGVESYELSKQRPISEESFEIIIKGQDYSPEQQYAIPTNTNCKCDYVVKRNIGQALIRQLPVFTAPSSATATDVDPVFIMKDQLALHCGTYAVCFNSDPNRLSGTPDQDKFVRVGPLFNVSCVQGWDLRQRQASYGLYPNSRIDSLRISGLFLSEYDRIAFSKLRPAGKVTPQGYYPGDTSTQDGTIVDDWKTGTNNINYNPCHDLEQMVNVMSVSTCKNVNFNPGGTSVDVSGLYFQEAGDYRVCYEMNGVWYELCGSNAETGLDNRNCIQSVIKIENVKVKGYTASPRNPHSDCPWTLTLKGEGFVYDGSMRFGLSTQPTCSEGEYTFNDQIVKQPRFVYDATQNGFHGYREENRNAPYETAYGVRHREALTWSTNITRFNVTNRTITATRVQVPPGIYFVCFEHTRMNRDCKWERVPGVPISVYGPVYYDVPKLLTVCSKKIQVQINGFFHMGHTYEFSLAKASGALGGVQCNKGNRFRHTSITNFGTNLTQWLRKIQGVYPRPFITAGRPAFENIPIAELDSRCISLTMDACNPKVGCDWDVIQWKCRRYQGETVGGGQQNGNTGDRSLSGDFSPYATEFGRTVVNTIIEFDHSMLMFPHND